jgi:hypothetical protein
MKDNKNRQWQALLLGLVLLTVGCSKEKDEVSILAENEKMSAAELEIKQQEADNYHPEYFKTNNQERVITENNIIDDLNADTQSGKK